MKSNILYIMLILGVFTSCKKVLEEENKTRYSAEYIYSTEGGLKLAVNAIYPILRSYARDTESSASFALERGTDLAVTNGGTGNFFGIYDPNNLRPAASQAAHMWRTMYEIIGKTNEIISAGKNFPETAALKVTLAEAKCFRAQAYFLLFRTYDRIWLNTEPTTWQNVDEPKLYKAATSAEVFQLLYSDLSYAIVNLPWKSTQPGRFNQAAARHIKAKASLWIKDWDEALAQVDTIDKSGFYGLVALDSIFNSGNLNHREALLVQQWSRNPGGNLSEGTPLGNHSSIFIASYRQEIGGTAEYACSWENWGYTFGRCLPSPYLFSLYDVAKDKRYNSFYIHRYKNTTPDVKISGSVTVRPGEFFPLYKNGIKNRFVYPGCTKYGDIWTKTTPAETRSYKDVILCRLAETYIIGAEAALMKGDQTLAKQYFNKTWERAGNTKYIATLTIKDVIDEQARELSFEGDRWYFLKRLGILIPQVRNYAGDPEITSSIAGRTNLPANPHFIRWPIPEAEVINMGAENFPQNPGYN